MVQIQHFNEYTKMVVDYALSNATEGVKEMIEKRQNESTDPISVASGDYTLKDAEMMKAILLVSTGSTTNAIIAQPVPGMWFRVQNNDTERAVTVKAPDNSGVSIPAGMTADVQFDGTDYVDVGNVAHISTLVATAEQAAEDAADMKDQVEVIFEGATGRLYKINDFVGTGKNKFNKVAAISGYVNQSTGAIVSPSTSLVVGEYMRVLPSTAYYFPTGANTRIAYYDIDKVFISGAINPTVPVTTPENCYYVRYSFPATEIDTQQFEQGSTATAYEDFTYVLSGNIKSPNVFWPVQVYLPPKIPVVVGHEVNIYFANVIGVDNLNNYHVDVVCTKGKHQNERWTYTPAEGDIGETTITINVYAGTVLAGTATSTLQTIAESAGDGLTKSVLVIGDSTTRSEFNVPTLYGLLDADVLTATFIGTQGTSPANHEGKTGWTANMFATDATSPFVFLGSFNFATYLSENEFDAPDIVIFNLGINDLFSAASDSASETAITLIKTRLDAMITNIKLSNANTKFGIAVTIPSGNQDAFAAYGAGQTSWRYNRNNRLLVKRLIEYYSGKESDNIYLIPLNVCLDTVHNAQFAAEEPINSRNPTTIQRATNGVHPGEYGYYQIADMQYYWLKSIV